MPQVRFLAQGRATAAGMAPNWLGATWSARLSGQTAWRGQLDLEPGGEHVLIDSDLIGLGSSLPAPLSKGAAQPLPLRVASQPQGDGRMQDVRLGGTVSVWRSTAMGGFDRGEIRFGGQAMMPGESGLRLAGSGRGMDISGWAALLPEGDGRGVLPLLSIDLGFDTFDLMGRRYQDVHLRGRTRSGVLRTQVSARESAAC